MGEPEEADDSQSPGYHFMAGFEAMNHLLDKLSSLEYTKYFCPEYKCKPLHRYYFAVQSNPGEQFYTFSCLSAWLIKSKCKLAIEGSLNPQEYEDPNVTIASILEGFHKALAAQDGQPTEIGASRLKQGYGTEVMAVLAVLTDCALKVAHQQNSATIRVKGLIEASDEDEMAANEDNELEINFEEHYALIDEEVVDSEFPFGDGLVTTQADEPLKQVLLSTTDTADWALEVERVLPQLKVVLRASDHKADWRLHVQEMHSHKKDVDEHFVGTRDALGKLGAEVHKNLDKVGAREKYLQLQLEPIVNEYNSLQGHLKTIMDNYRVVSGGVTEKSRQLSELSDELETVKSEMEERGSSMTDGTPLVSLRKALQRIKAELATIDIRIGVATQTILQANLHENAAQQLLHRQHDSPIKLQRNTLQRLVF